MRYDLEKVDEILATQNISYTGEEIRKKLFQAGYIVVRNDEPPGKFSCHVCGCEMPSLAEYVGWGGDVPS